MGIVVVDASVLVDALGGHGPRSRRAKLALLGMQPVAPAHARIETVGAWRRHVRSGALSESDATASLSNLARLNLKEVSIEPLIRRIWELRENLTVADAAYVALAESWNIPLVTCDARLANAPGARCEVQLIG